MTTPKPVTNRHCDLHTCRQFDITSFESKNYKPENIRIAFFDTKPYDRRSFSKLNQSFGFNIKYLESKLSANTLPLTRDCQVVCLFVNDSLTADMVSTLVDNNIQLLALRCAGYNNIDLKSLFGHIPIVHVPAYSPHAVAEHALALILSLNRKTHRAYYRTRDNNFSINGLLGFDMVGKTIGVIGTGRIGRTFIELIQGFHMNILAYDAHPNAEFAQQFNVTYVPLSEVFTQSDIINIHCPLTHETKHLINADTINQMKPGVMIINTSRGQLINTNDLIESLKNGKVAAAGLDVYEEEADYFFEDLSNDIVSDDTLARLLTFPNVLITSHQGFFTQEAISNIAQTTLENIRVFFEKQQLQNQICFKCGH